MIGTETAHFEAGVRCGTCGKVWPCPAYQADYRAAMRERNAVQDQQWARPQPILETAPVRNDRVS